jgi:hypothetical protein
MKNILESHIFAINCVDDENDAIIINLTLILYDNNSWRAELRDSKKRFFVLETPNGKYNSYTFEQYLDCAITNHLHIVYDYFEGYISVYLNGGGFCDQANCLSQVENNQNLFLLDKKINNYKQMLLELEKCKEKIEHLYPTS